MRKIFFLVILCIRLTSWGQTDEGSLYYAPPIKIDTMTRKTSAPLPFDRAFVLQYELKKGDVVRKLFLYPVDVKNGKREILLTAPGRVSSKHKQFLDSCWTSGNTLNIQIKYLPPNTLIDIGVLKPMNSEDLGAFSRLNEELYAISRGNGSRSPEELKICYDSLIQTLRSNQYPNTNRLFKKYSFAQYDSLFRASLYPAYHALNTYAFNDRLPSFSPGEFSLTDSVLRVLKLSNTELVRLYRVLNSGQLQNIAGGTLRIGTSNLEEGKADSAAYPNRIANLSASIKVLDSLLYTVDQAILATRHPALPAFKGNLEVLQGVLQRNKKVLADQQKRITDILTMNSYLYRDEWLMSGNDFTDLVTKSRFLLVPDFGIANMAVGGRDKVHFVPRPFIGTNIYFRPVDKTLRERTLPYWDWRRIVSLQIGLTFGSFESTEFTNLFNDFSILIGPSFKLNRSFRLSPGVVLLKSADENPLLTQQKVSAGFYAAFSFDIDILSNASSRTRVIK